MTRKILTDQEIVGRLAAFNFFKKEQSLRDLSQLIILLMVGLGMMFLLKIPFLGFRPILIAGESFFFRYSFFGNVILVISLLRLFKLTENLLQASFLVVGVLLFSLHGISSLFDPTETFITNPFLGLMTAAYPLILILGFDFIFPKFLKWCWRLVTISSFLVYTAVFYVMYGMGVLFVSSASRFGKILMLFKISEMGDLLRSLHFLIGFLYLIAFLIILRRKKKIIEGFEEMEKIAYLG